MGTIKKLYQDQLVGQGSAGEVYPVTSALAVYDSNNVSLQERLNDLDTTAANTNSLLKNIGYFVCETAALTATKAVVAEGYTLLIGGSIKIKMTYANTSTSTVKLNINSTGAKTLYYQGAQVSSTNTWKDGEVVEVYYDGTDYYANNVESQKVVDNLEEGGTSNVLSAEQGKVLDGKISQLGQAINGLAQTTFTLGAIRSSDGEVISADNREYTDYIDLSGLSKITYTRPVSTSSNPTWGMAWYDESKVRIGGLVAKSGQSAGYEVDERTVPANAKYARFTRYSDPALGEFWIKLYDSFENRIESLEGDMQNVEGALEEGLSGLEQQIVDVDSKFNLEEEIDLSQVEETQFYPNSSDEWTKTTSASRAKVIEVNPGEKYHLSTLYDTKYYILKTYYPAAGTPVDYATGSGNEDLLVGDGVDVIIPSDGHYLGARTYGKYNNVWQEAGVEIVKTTTISDEVKKLDNGVVSLKTKLPTISLSDLQAAAGVSGNDFTADIPEISIADTGGILDARILTMVAKYTSSDPSLYPSITIYGDAIKSNEQTYIAGGEGSFSVKQWRVPPTIGGATVKVKIDIPSGVTLTIKSISLTQGAGLNRSAFKFYEHSGIWGGDFNVRLAFDFAALGGYYGAVVVPKFSTSGDIFCYHDDTFGDTPNVRMIDGSSLPAASLQECTSAQIEGMEYVTENVLGEHSTIPTLDEFFATCNKTGLHPCLSCHPVPSVAQWGQIKALAEKHNVLHRLAVKFGYSSENMENAFSVLGNDIEAYYFNISTGTTIAEVVTVLDAIAFDKSKVDVGVEFMAASYATDAKIAAIMGAGYKWGVFENKPDILTLIDLMAKGASEWTIRDHFSNGLNW